jgi:hypothetical protein
MPPQCDGGGVRKPNPCSMNWQVWCLLSDWRNTTGSSRTLAPSVLTTRCCGYWKLSASSRFSREKCLRRSPQNASRCGRFLKVLHLKPMQLTNGWLDTHHTSNHALLSCRRNWKQGWTRFELRSCWARVCDSVSSSLVCRIPPERLTSLARK